MLHYIIVDISTRRFSDMIDACEVSVLYLENCANLNLRFWLIDS